MNTLTFAFDCQLNDLEDYVAEGTVVEVVDTWRKSEGFTPVLITKCFTYEGMPMDIKQVEYFMNESFVELRN